MTRPTRSRLVLAVIVAVVVPLGLLTKQYQGPGADWVQGNSGAVLYEVLWIALAQGVWLRSRTWKIALIVFLATCGVELLQLCNAGWLVAVRETLPGKLVLGTNHGFDPMDFLHYLAGSILGFLICFRIREPSNAGNR